MTYGLIGWRLELVNLFALRLLSLPLSSVSLAAPTGLFESILNFTNSLESLSLLHAALESDRWSFAKVWALWFFFPRLPTLVLADSRFLRSWAKCDHSFEVIRHSCLYRRWRYKFSSLWSFSLWLLLLHFCSCNILDKFGFLCSCLQRRAFFLLLFFDYTEYIFIIAKAARGNSTMEFWRIGVYIL